MLVINNAQSSEIFAHIRLTTFRGAFYAVFPACAALTAAVMAVTSDNS